MSSCASLIAAKVWSVILVAAAICAIVAAWLAFGNFNSVLTDATCALDGLIAMDQPTLTFARLTGEVWTNPALASGTGLLNAHTAQWDDEVIALTAYLQRLGTDRPSAAVAGAE